MVGITVTAGVPGRAGLAELEEPERRDNELRTRLVEPRTAYIARFEIVVGPSGRE